MDWSVMKNKFFLDKSVIITGASSGIGRELALRLALCGACLTLTARNTELLEEVIGLCREKGAKAVFLAADVSQQADCSQLVEKAVDTYNRIDILINNAGIAMFARFDELNDLKAAESLFKTNFWGGVYCTHYALAYLKQTKGSIVMVNSGSGKFPMPLGSIYSASKHALTGFTDALRAELKGSGISVTSIFPDWVATGITGRALDFSGKPFGSLHPREEDAMSPQVCAGMILNAVARRKREVYTSLRQRFGVIFRSFAPGITERLATQELCLFNTSKR